MIIKESLHFIYEKEDYLWKRFNIYRSYAHHGLEGIYAATKWLQTSIFKDIVSDITCYVSDEPINFPGELAIDDGDSFEPVIYMNIMSITADFQNKEYLIDLKKSRTTCFEYAAFVLLHEIGHYIHALIGGSGKNKKERLFDYFDRGEYHYERFVKSMKLGDTREEKKRYRNIPHEKAADNFARQYIDCIFEN